MKFYTKDNQLTNQNQIVYAWFQSREDCIAVADTLNQRYSHADKQFTHGQINSVNDSQNPIKEKNYDSSNSTFRAKIPASS